MKYHQNWSLRTGPPNEEQFKFQGGVPVELYVCVIGHWGSQSIRVIFAGVQLNLVGRLRPVVVKMEGRFLISGFVRNQDVEQQVTN